MAGPPWPPRRWAVESLHGLNLTAWPVRLADAFLFAAVTDQERAAAADWHRAQADQLANHPAAGALAAAYRELQPTWLWARRLLGPNPPLSEVLRCAPREVGERVAARLRAAGFTVDWPPPPEPEEVGP